MESYAVPENTWYTNCPFKLHVGNLSHLWSDTGRVTVPSHLVVTPTNLHQRNLEERLREAKQPHSNFVFQRIGALASNLANEKTNLSSSLDRVDRLALIREVLKDSEDPVYKYLAAALGSPLGSHVEPLERTQSELELVTGFHPSRMATFASLLGEQTAPSREDTLDLLAGVSHLHHDLHRRLSDGGNNYCTQAVSETSLLCRAIQTVDADESVWASVYPDVETLSVTGVSMLTAPIEDLCRLVSKITDVDVHLHLREVTGSQISQQLAAESDIEQFGTQEVFKWR